MAWDVRDSVENCNFLHLHHLYADHLMQFRLVVDFDVGQNQNYSGRDGVGLDLVCNFCAISIASRRMLCAPFDQLGQSNFNWFVRIDNIHHGFVCVVVSV